MTHSPDVRVLALVTCIATTLVACGFGDREVSASRAPQGWNPDCSDCQSASDGPVQPDDDSKESPEPSAQDVCQPRPPRVSLDDRPELPERPSAMTCHKLEADHGSTADVEGETQRRIAWQLEDGRVVKRIDTKGAEQQPFGFEERVEFAFHEDGTLERVERYRRGGMPAYHHVHQRTRWRFDTRGRLVERSRVVAPATDPRDNPQPDFDASDGIYVVDLEQRWEGGDIVERTIRTEGRREQAETYHWKWFYDADGRVERTKFESSDGPDGRVEWTYDDGRPVRAERFVGGQLRVDQAWTYRNDGTLERRTVDVPDWSEPGPPLTDSQTLDRNDRDGAGSAYRRLRRLTSLFDSGRREGCQPLSGDIGHGYGSDRPAYRTAWEGEIDLQTVGMAYGSAYLQSWNYGHHGMVLGTHSLAGATDIRSTIEYDRRGRMIRESTDFVPYEARSGDDKPEDSRRVERRRTRTFDEGRLVADRLVRRAGGEKRIYLLRFRRDGNGRLQRRELYHDGDLVAAHDFGWDDRGRWTSLELRRVTGPGSTGESSGLGSTATFERQLDSEGRTLRLEVAYADEAREVQTWTYDEHGVVRHRTGNQEGFHKREYWERDDLGRVLSYRSVDESGGNERVGLRTNRYTCNSGRSGGAMQ